MINAWDGSHSEALVVGALEVIILVLDDDVQLLLLHDHAQHVVDLALVVVDGELELVTQPIHWNRAPNLSVGVGVEESQRVLAFDVVLLVEVEPKSENSYLSDRFSVFLTETVLSWSVVLE